MTDDPEIPKTSDTIIASAQADTTPGALSDASVTDKPGGGGVLFDTDGNPIAPVEVPEPAPSNEADDLVYRTPEQRAAFDKFNADAVVSVPSSTFPADVPISEPGKTVDTRDTKIAELETDVESIKADLLYLRSLHGWPVEEGNKLKAYYHDGLKKLGIGE